MDYVRGMDAEEDIQDLRFLLPCLNPSHGIVFLLRSKRAFHRCGPDSGQLLSDIVLLRLLSSWTATLYK